jgi:hypothetical protein
MGELTPSWGSGLFYLLQDLGSDQLKRGLIGRNNLRPYTGDVIQYNDDKTEVVIRGSLKDRRWHGQYESFGQPAQKSRYNNGEKCGVWSELLVFTSHQPKFNRERN